MQIFPLDEKGKRSVTVVTMLYLKRMFQSTVFISGKCNRKNLALCSSRCDRCVYTRGFPEPAEHATSRQSAETAGKRESQGEIQGEKTHES